MTHGLNSKAPDFSEHGLRSRVLAEVHARPSVPIEGARRILHFAFTTDRQLLARLTALAAKLEASAAHTLFRFGATRAYHELVRHRLEVIGEKPLPNLPTLAAFLTRRLMPAIRTCASTDEHQENLSQNLVRAAQLLRTRVEIELESQNKDLLSGMSDRFKLQLRLQQAVKGVSIVAITYYLLTILRLIYEGMQRKIQAFDPALATAISVPFVFAIVVFLFRRRAKKLDRADK